MENPRFRGRKRYCCYYCNTYFFQVDAWQRHNRKHTGVEIECDDCGEMCSDHFELKAHQQLCEGYHVYSDEVYVQEDHQNVNRQPIISEKPDKNVHETPDSTSKQESGLDIEETIVNGGDDTQEITTDKKNIALERIQEEHMEKELSDDKTKKDGEAKNSELDDLIGEDKAQLDSASPDEVDTDTEALIGIDQTVSHMVSDDPESKQININDDNNNIDKQIVIKVESALTESKHRVSDKMSDKDNNNLEIPMFINRTSPVGSSTIDSMQALNMDVSEINKKYQPYFCKNCGARFTRKDSVTRHLKKGTCSGKSAIVCNICGKVSSEMFELQDHFKLEHKNIVFTAALVHRNIHPRVETHEQPHYPHYPGHYVVPDQHIVSASRSYIPPDQSYRPMPPGLQAMFYGPRPGYPPPPRPHFHEHVFPTRHVDTRFSTANHIGNDVTYINNPGKLFVNSNEDRKREYSEIIVHEQQHDDTYRKNRKFDIEYLGKPHVSTAFLNDKTEAHRNINLSEYTNNAMSSKQYYDNRFTKMEQQSNSTAGKEEPPRIHQCKVCGLEFPRFEYLLTHLRKHKEKSEIVDPIDEKNIPHKEGYHTPDIYPSRLLNDSNSSSSDDNNESHHQKPHFVMSQSLERVPIVQSTHEPIMVQKPHFSMHHPVSERYMQHEQVYPPPHQTHPKTPVMAEGPMDAITPGIDGKFRPFICENCGQRFTRKDSLVRHAKKQTCFEEIVDLKCKHCDKTFRYNKCLAQHQQLVHGIATPDEPKRRPSNSEDEESESDRSEKNDAEMKHKKGEDIKQENSQQDLNLAKLQRYPGHQNQYTRHIPSHDHHLLSQVHHLPQHMPPTAKFVGVSNEEKLKPQDMNHTASNVINHATNNVSTHESQYIGYCMLPRPFQCEYCGDRFAHRHSLKRHVRRHLGIGIPCHDCGKLYRDQSEWRRHQRSIHNRYYEKSDVPSRMSFRDGVEQGLIGIVPRSEYENQIENEESDSERSDEEISMVKLQSSQYQPIVSTIDNNNPPISIHHPLVEQINSHSENKLMPQSPALVNTTKRENEKPNDDKEDKLKVFNFTSHTAGDKDSRKSVLDLYLCSPQTDGENEKNNNKEEAVTH